MVSYLDIAPKRQTFWGHSSGHMEPHCVLLQFTGRKIVNAVCQHTDEKAERIQLQIFSHFPNPWSGLLSLSGKLKSYKVRLFVLLVASF